MFLRSNDPKRSRFFSPIALIVFALATWQLYYTQQLFLEKTSQFPFPPLTVSESLLLYSAIAVVGFIVGLSGRFFSKRQPLSDISPSPLPESLTALLTPEGRIIEASASLLQFLDQPAEAILHKPFWEILSQRQSQGKKAIAKAALGNSTCFLGTISRVTDPPNIFSISLQPLLNPTQEVTHILAQISYPSPQLPPQNQQPQEASSSDSLYEIIFNHALEAIFLVKVLPDDQFIIEALNPANAQALGLSPSQAVGKSIDEIVPPDVAEKIKQHYRVPLQTRDTYTYEESIELPNSTSYWRTILVPIEDEEGRIVKLLGSGRNITSEKEALLALQESEKRFRSAIFYAPYPTIIHAEDGEVLEINQAWTELTGYTHADIPTLAQWTEKAYGVQKPKVQTKIKEAYRAQQREDAGEYTVRTKGGDNIIWDFSFAPLGRLPDGRKMIISMAKDVTKPKELEQKVRDREGRIRRIIESNMIGIGYWNIEGGVIEANKALLNMIGYSHEDLEANRINWQNLTPPEHLYKDEQALQEIRRRGYTTPYEKEYIRKDGKRVPVLVGSCGLEGNPSEGYFFVLNLSKRKRAETALKKSQEIFQRFMDYSPVFTYIKDTNGRYIFVNRAVEKAWKRPLKEWVGKTDFDLLSPEIASEMVKHDQQVLKENRALEFLETTEHDEGTRYWITVKFPIEDPAKPGKFLVGGKSLDITEQKRAEQALKRSEARMHHLVEANIIGVFFADFNGHIYNANDAFLNLIGYSREDLQEGRIRWDEITPPEYASIDAEIIANVKKTGKSPTVEKEYIRKDGTHIPILIGVALLPEEEEEGKCVCYAVNIRDRKQAQKVLEQYAQQQAIIAQLGQLALSGSDLDSLFDLTTHLVASALGVEYCKVLELLENKEEVLLRSGVGWQKGLVGHATVGTDLDSQAGYTLISHEPVIVQDLNTETRFSGPPLLREHGVVSGMSVIIGNVDQPWGVLGAHTTQKRTFTPEDINFLQAVANVLSNAIERKNADFAIRELNTTLETRVAERTAQLQEINEELKAFTYTVSHDLRAPLRAIQGFAIALAEDYEDSLDELGLDYTDRLVKAAQRLDRLIEDLLNYSRLSRSDLLVRPVNLSRVLEDVQESLAEEIENKQVKIEVQQPLGKIIGNRSILLQVIANLLINAIKFVSEDKKTVIRIWSEEKEDYIRLCIEDNGIGINPEHLERIFNVFERLHSVDHYAGTGIGLAIVRKGMERLGGQVGVESHVGKGSTFWIEGKKVKEINLNKS